ncbi:MAG: hypothetical protein WCA49_08560 [Candidatus Sulfotelmatobacter sp.]
MFSATGAKRMAFGLVLAVLFGLSPAQAQEAKPLPRHPGDVIKYEIKFDGPNADKIKTVSASLGMRVGPPKDQAGFNNGFGTQGSTRPSAPNTFIVEMTVPDNAATGDYYLNVGASATAGSAGYSDGQEFNTPPIHIENPKTFTPPGIKVTPLP